MAIGHERGRWGEALVAGRLEEEGWTVLDRNWRFGHKEVDLVVLRGDLVAFVEVKTRTGASHGDPLEAVTPRKCREVEAVARAWLRTRGRELGGGFRVRFDAVGVTLGTTGPPVVRHVPDAWRSGGS